MLYAIVSIILLLINVTTTTDGGRNKRGISLTLTQHDLNYAIRNAEQEIDRLQRFETSIGWSNIEVEEETPSHGHLIESLPSSEALAFGRQALVADKASGFILEKHCIRRHIPKDQCISAMKNIKFSGTSLSKKCIAQFGTVQCEKSKYRSHDGSCNNPNHPSWGQAYSPYTRLLSPQYADGIMEPRRNSRAKGRLPNPRNISNQLVRDLDKPDKDTTLALVQWTQFISNDLFHTPVSKMVHTGKAIECCHPSGRGLSPRYIHPMSCQQISIPDTDPDYSPHRVTCMSYVKSLTSLRSTCNFGPADQMNQASHFLDGSMLYGSSFSRSIVLRAMSGGRLSTVIKNNEELLPQSPAPQLQCQVQNEADICYASGDSRVNNNPHHTAMYTVWVREHNRVADALHNINPHWDDDTLYNEARRIVIAQIQHITYQAWLPRMFGKQQMSIRKTSPYDETVDPTVTNSFATAGLNFISSMLQRELRLYDNKRQRNTTLFLKDHFYKPAVTQEPGVMDGLLRGLTQQQSQQLDASIIEDLTSLLYRGNKDYGLDIIALDIQRGRDHGLPGYNSFRRFCQLPANSRFETFSDTMSLSNINQLKSVYANTEDVDLVIGALLETPVRGSKMGAVLQCIVGEQLDRTRRGDRYFYENPGHPHSFSNDQINELKKCSLGRILCDNAPGINDIQLDVFTVPSAANPLLDCSRIPTPNFNFWKDNKK